MRGALAILIAMLAATPAAGAITDADKTALAGEWRLSCGEAPAADETRIVIEFALTGGVFNIDDGTEDSGTFAIAAKDGSTFELKDGRRFVFAGGPLRWNGMSFQHCRGPADRSAIRLSKAQIAQISSAMPPDQPVFVDARAKGGCKALDYQYLTLDLVGPLGFSLGRWNSADLAERAKSPFDEVTNWTVDKAEPISGGYRLTLTERIPPNGARGDTTTVTLLLAGGRMNVPEWNRSYLRCPKGFLAAE